jgi:hypothetical protein
MKAYACMGVRSILELLEVSMALYMSESSYDLGDRHQLRSSYDYLHQHKDTHGNLLRPCCKIGRK